jgi:RND family efflux transporter MFP subunit
MTTMIKTPRWLPALVAALTLAAAGCGRSSEQVAASERPPLEVPVVTLALAEVTDSFEAGGVIQARTSATLTSRILAPVREVRVAPGDRVRAGQTLIVLDGADLAAQARSARAAALGADQAVAAAAADQEAAAAALALARSAHERIASLHAKRSATAQELDEATAALRRAEANAAGAAARARGAGSGLDRWRAAADAASTTASFAAVTAPFDGIVTEKLVDPGNMATPGAPLLRVDDASAFRLDVRVDESRAARIAQGNPVKVILEEISGPATLEGKVAEVSRAVDADARAFLVKIELPAGAATRSGAFGRAVFAGPTRQALTVPETALTRRGQLTSVFVVEEGVARLRLVSIRGTEVLAGLAAGDVVVADAPPGLADGRRVTPGVQR